MKDLGKSLLKTEIAQNLKELNPKAYKRYVKLERGGFFNRIGTYFVLGLNNFFDHNYSVWENYF